MTAVAEEDFPASAEQGGELAEGSGGADELGGFTDDLLGIVLIFERCGVGGESAFLLCVVVFLLGRGRGFGDGEFSVLDELGAAFVEFGVVGIAVFVPGGLPFFRTLLGELGVDFFGVVDGEVVGEAPGWAVVGDAALVEDEDGVVEFEVGE